jgi:hypothetical protein
MPSFTEMIGFTADFIFLVLIQEKKQKKIKPPKQ